MKPLYKGLAVALVHILIVLSLGGKLLYDRHTRPRIWVRTGSVDPDLPIRGRYLTLNLEVHVPDYKSGKLTTPGLKEQLYDFGHIELAVEDGKLVGHKSDRPTEMYIRTWGARTRTDDIFLLSSPVLFFIPEHAI